MSNTKKRALIFAILALAFMTMACDPRLDTGVGRRACASVGCR